MFTKSWDHDARHADKEENIIVLLLQKNEE